jgi:hypothetical protein
MALPLCQGSCRLDPPDRAPLWWGEPREASAQLAEA